MEQSQCVKNKTMDLESQYKITDFELQCLKEETIDFESITLSVEYIERIAVLLGSSSLKTWKEVNLSDCGICGHIHMIYCKLRKCTDVTIKVMKLNDNNMTAAEAPCVSGITINCNVEKLFINGNHGIGESEQLYIMLTSLYTNLKELHMCDVNLLRNGVDLFKALQHNNTLKELVMENNNITDVACIAITTALKDNNCLIKLWMWKNKISGKTSILILDTLRCNDSLESLGLPNPNENTISIIRSLEETVNKERKDRKCFVGLKVHFK